MGEADGSTKTSRLRPYLELCRIYLAPTAIADSLAGFALAAVLGRLDSSPVLLLVVAGSSVLLYVTGMVTNDLFDLSKDRAKGARKPLVTGAVRPVAAIALAVLLAAAALGCALLANAAWVAGVVLALSLAYNGGGKRLPIVGNLLMGGCRSGNFLLGAVAAGGPGTLTHTTLLVAAALLGLFVAVVTAVSLLEDGRPRRATLFGLAGSTLVLPMVLILVDPRSPSAWIGGGVLAFQLLLALFAMSHPPVGVPQATVFVRRALGAIATVDAAIVLAFVPSIHDSVIPVAALYAIGFFAWWTKRRWLQSDGPET